jgi:methionyl-tRNA formyltransferase
VFIPDEGVDTGPIVVQRRGVSIEPNETTGSLYFKKLYPLGLEAIVAAVRLVESGAAEPVAQDESRATFQGLVDDRVACIDLETPVEEIHALVRGCDPQPGAFLRIRGKSVRLYNASLEPTSGKTGTVVSIDDEGIVIALRGGNLRVGRVRADQGKEPAQAFGARTGLQGGESVESGEPPTP